MKREVDCKFNKKITIFATVYDYLKDLILKDMKTDYFSQRSSIREYDNKSIPESLIRDIIERAMRAPTCGNMQLYSVIITRDPNKKAKLSEQHFNQPAATNSDLILTICADFNRFSRWCEISGATPGYSNFHSFITALTDAVILAQQIVTIAEMEGLGTCYLGTVTYNADAISNLLELPSLVVPVASISIGYPKNIPAQVERLPIEAILHNEIYRKDSDEDIRRLYKAKEEFPENIEYVKINSKPSLASIFTDIRYPNEMNELISQKFLSLLNEKDFLPH